MSHLSTPGSSLWRALPLSKSTAYWNSNLREESSMNTTKPPLGTTERADDHVKGSFSLMTTSLSNKARSFLRDNHLTVFSTINRDGSPQLTTVLYTLNDDETIVMNVQRNSQKAKNMRRDPRVAMCVRDGNRYVSMNGAIEFIDDAEIIRRDLERLGLLGFFLAGDEDARRDDAANMMAQQRVSVRFKIQKVTERLG
jgi:PPOX class probable F420-dependent enzyme